MLCSKAHLYPPLGIDFEKNNGVVRHRSKDYYKKGIRVFHLLADYHGRSRDGSFVLDLIRAAHKTFVDAGIRQEVTLLGSGGMILAEHIPKALLCGLDAVAIDILEEIGFERDARFKYSS